MSEDGFKLFINDDLYESYSYDDLPLTLEGFEGDSEATYHFLVRDKVYEGCASDKWFGPVDCETDECRIWDMQATVLPCNDDNEFNVLLNFFYENVGNNGFKVVGNGNNYGTFDYDDLPVELGPFEADGEAEYEFEARDLEFEGCYDWTVVEAFECETVPQITNLDIEITDCIEAQYMLSVSFDHAHTGVDGFIIHGNGMEAQSFSYDELPVSIGPLINDFTTSYYFTIRDKSNSSFGNWDRFLPFNCNNLSVEENGIIVDLQVFPNPSQGVLNFRNTGNEKMDLLLISTSGQVLRSFKIDSGGLHTLNDLDAGLYLYRIVTDSGTATGKLIVN